MHENMDRQEYITYALSQIDDNTVWCEAEKELSSHIDDREEYFRNCGYDNETAAKMAVERMGSPEAAADGFSKVHNGKKKITAILAVLSLPLSVLYFYTFLLSNAILYDNNTMGTGIAEALSLLFIIGISVIGKRRNSRFICLVAVLNFLSTYGFFIWVNLSSEETLLCSHIIFKLAALLTLDFEALNTFWLVEGITVAPYLTVLSLVFYAVIFISLILVFVSVCILKKPTYSLKKRQFTKKAFKAQKIILFFVLLTVLILPKSNSFDKDKDMTVKVPEDVDTLIIAQSDTPCSLKEIPPEDILIMVFSDRMGANILHFNDSTEKAQEEKRFQNITVSNAKKNNWININGYYIKKECGGKLSYSVFQTDVPLNLTKDCVYIEFIDYDSAVAKLSVTNAHKLASNASENWHKTGSTDKISAAIDAYNQVEITFNKSP